MVWPDTTAEQSRPFRSMVELTSTGQIMTLAEAQYELGIDPQQALTGTARQTQEDAAVQATIVAAQSWCEGQVERTFRTTVERVMTLDRLDRVIECWDPPLISIDSVEYLDDADTFQTIDAANYRVITPTEGKGRLQFIQDFDRPEVRREIDSVKVTYTSGYAVMPPNAVAAAKLMLTVLWDNDESPQLIEVYQERAENLLEPLSWGSYE